MAQRSPRLEPVHHVPARPPASAASSPATVSGGVPGLLALQRSAGNRTVVNLLRSGVSIQRKAGDVSRPDYELIGKVREFLSASDRNMATLYPPLKELLLETSSFKSPDLRKLSISFKRNGVTKFIQDKKDDGGVYAAANELVALVLKDFEADRKVDAQTLEGATGGHSVDRHGPEVTDVALQTRLTTGVAPDNVLSVAPGYSSKFVSYTAWIDTRQKAIDTLSAAVNLAQLRLIGLEPKLPAAKLKEDQLEDAVTTATGERGLKNIAHQRAKGQRGEGSDEAVAAKEDLEKANTKLSKATNAKAVGAASLSAMLDRLDVPVDRSLVDLADIESFKVKPAYRVIVDNGKPIGSGWKGTGAQAPATIAHGGREVEDAVLYGGTEKTEPLTKSLTTLDGGAGGTPLLTAGVGGPPATPNAALRVASWNVVQHFPAPPDASAGIE